MDEKRKAFCEQLEVNIENTTSRKNTLDYIQKNIEQLEPKDNTEYDIDEVAKSMKDIKLGSIGLTKEMLEDIEK